MYVVLPAAGICQDTLIQCQSHAQQTSAHFSTPSTPTSTINQPTPGPELPLEDFNRYALLLDVDGNAWSDRYRLLTHFNTPVLKQASNLTAFFEHLMAPGVVVEQYAPDLSDLPVRARQLLDELQQQPDRLVKMAGEGEGVRVRL